MTGFASDQEVKRRMTVIGLVSLLALESSRNVNGAVRDMSHNPTGGGWYLQPTYRSLVSTIHSFASSARNLWICGGILSVPLMSLFIMKQSRWGHLFFLDGLHNILTSRNLAFTAAILTTIFAMSVSFLSRVILIKARVYSSEDRLMFSLREVPGFCHQDRASDALVQFRHHLDDLLSVEYPDSLSRAVAIRHWVRCQQPQDAAAWVTERAVDSEDPHHLLRQQRSGVPGACRRFSYILLGALLSAGFDARLLFFASSPYRRQVILHAIVEVWIVELNQWVLLDPTHDCIMMIGGRAASAIELLSIMEDGDSARVVFDRNGSALEPVPRAKFFGKCCRHLFLGLSNAVFDGYSVRMFGAKRIHFMHYGKSQKYPELSKRILIGAASVSALLSMALWASFVVVFCTQ